MLSEDLLGKPAGDRMAMVSESALLCTTKSGEQFCTDSMPQPLSPRRRLGLFIAPTTAITLSRRHRIAQARAPTPSDLSNPGIAGVTSLNCSDRN
jgi:hypothetical protein